MYKISNYTENKDIRILDQRGPFTVVEHLRFILSDDNSVNTYNACRQLNEWQHRVICDLSRGSVSLSRFPIHWSSGQFRFTRNPNFSFMKALGGYPVNDYNGNGTLFFHPTWYRPILVDIAEWNHSVTVNHSMFIACESTIGITLNIPALPNVSVQNEPHAALNLQGTGIIALNSPVAREDLVKVELQDDVVEFVGNHVVAWSSSLIYSLKSNDNADLVRVFEGTGTVWLA